MYNYLDFEKPVADLDGQIFELKKLAATQDSLDTEEEIGRLERRSNQALRDLYKKLTPWQKAQVARHPDRPHCLDYLNQLFTDVTPLAGDRKFGEDEALLAGMARFQGEAVVFLGQEKGHDTQTRLRHNFGSARPEGYRKAVRIMELAQHFALPVISLVAGKPVAVFRNPYWVMPIVAIVTIWWTNGFNVLLFIAGLRNISQDYYEAAALDGASRWQLFCKITWPLLWPVTALVLTLQFILQLKIFDQVYLLSNGGPFNSSYVLLLMVYREAFQLNQGGYASAVALVLFVLIAVFSILQFQLLKARGQR